MPLEKIDAYTLAQTLMGIEMIDPSRPGAHQLGDDEAAAAYAQRAALVYTALARAASLGYRAGFTIDPSEPDWPVAFIDLPTGQVSWHMPGYGGQFDGHTTPDKYTRIGAYVQQVAKADPGRMKAVLADYQEWKDRL